MKTDLMSDIDKVLDAQSDSRLDVMLTNVFGGYEHETPLSEYELQRFWEYGDFPNGGRIGYHRWGNFVHSSECTETVDADGDPARLCEVIQEKLGLDELMSPYNNYRHIKAYMQGLRDEVLDVETYMGDLPRVMWDIGEIKYWERIEDAWLMGAIEAEEIKWED